MVSLILMLSGVLLQQPIQIASISAQGSRLPADALIRLTQLQPGQTVDEKAFRTACDKLAETGLVSDVSYELKSKDLVFKMKDVGPLVHAVLDFSQGEKVWDWLKEHEPLARHELPRTKAAIGFYQRRIDEYFRSTGSNTVVNAWVTSDESGQPKAIEFRPVSPANEKLLGRRDDGTPDFALEPAFTQGHLIRRVAPIYPETARRARLQGTVVIEVTITEHGEVTDCRVVSGHPLLVPAALDAVKQWHYSPTRIDGVPVEVQTNLTVNFQLEQ